MKKNPLSKILLLNFKIQYALFRLISMNIYIAKQKIIRYTIKMMLFFVFVYLESLILKDNVLNSISPYIMFFLKITIAYALAVKITEKIKLKDYERFFEALAPQ